MKNDETQYTGESVARVVLKRHAVLCGLVSRVCDACLLQHNGSTESQIKAVETFCRQQSDRKK